MENDLYSDLREGLGPWAFDADMRCFVTLANIACGRHAIDPIKFEAQSICFHGDSRGAVEMARGSRQNLNERDVPISRLSMS